MALSARNHGLMPTLAEIVVYEPGCATYDLPREMALSLDLPKAASHPQALTHYLGLYFMSSRGAVLAADNRQCLSRRGFVVYLKTPLETLVERTRYDTSRPLLHSGDPAATLGEILQVRDPLYAEVADLVLDSGKLSVKQVLKMITEELQ